MGLSIGSGGSITSIEELCMFLDDAPPNVQQETIGGVEFILEGINSEFAIDPAVIDEIIDCLERSLGL